MNAEIKKATTIGLRNVTLRGRRTSLRLEPDFWSALEEIARREKLSINALCEKIQTRAGRGNLTAAVRLYALDYFRAAATETGHRAAGHGRLSTAG